MTPFATIAQLTTFWRSLSAEEINRGTLLLELASNRLRLIGADNGVDLDVKKDESAAFETTLRWVVMEAVKRALQAPVDRPPVESYGQTAGPYSENYKYTNPTGDLWFKKSELSALGLSGRQSLTSITPLTPENYYSF